MSLFLKALIGAAAVLLIALLSRSRSFFVAGKQRLSPPRHQVTKKIQLSWCLGVLVVKIRVITLEHT
jgi:uncharacterized membrane protein (GlpM family)